MVHSSAMFSTVLADPFLDTCHFCLCSHFLLASVSLHLSLYTVGLTSPDSLDIRLDVGGIILKYSISSPPFFETQGWNTTCDWKHPHLCGQHLSKPSLSKAKTRPLFCLSLENARHHAAQNTSNLAQMKELFPRYLFSTSRRSTETERSSNVYPFTFILTESVQCVIRGLHKNINVVTGRGRPWRRGAA